MRRILLVAVLVGLLIPALPAGAQMITAAAVKTNLDFPAAFALSSTGTIYYAERFTGEIRAYDPVSRSDTHVFTVRNVLTEGERGLLGLALHPQFTSGQAYIYAYATRRVGGRIRNSPKNQILRIEIRTLQSPAASVIFTSNVRPAQAHNGGIIHFGPDGRLYAQIGDATNPANAQNLAVTAGKFVRMTATGAVPADNPFVGTTGANGYVYSFGFRNGYGFAFDPQTGNLFDSQNGPNCNDELNRVVAAGNYAWGPNQTCSGTAPQNTNQDGPLPRILPLAFYNPTTAPAGAVFCASCGLTGSEGHLFLGEFNTGRVREIVLTADRLGVASQAVIYDHPRGILSLERGPDGTIYFSDSGGIYKLIRQ
ncbi:MAG: sorbosone dehydrogenase family protein [Actinomycetota bacterium]